MAILFRKENISQNQALGRPGDFVGILRSKLIVFWSIVLSVSFFLLPASSSLASYQARNYYGAKFESVDTVMHTAGQSIGDFNDYWNVMDVSEKPAVYMAYCNLVTPFVPALRADLDSYVQAYGVYMPVQLGLYVVGIEDEIAAGLWDDDIDTFCKALKQLGYPLYIRIGYECNGTWNGYDPTDYKAAFIRITNALRANNVEAATVFNVIQDSYINYYPGDDYVDWWSINMFSVWNVNHPITTTFLADAHSHGKPVLVGEADPTYWHTDQGLASWNGYFVPYFNMIESNAVIKNFCYINTNWGGDWGDCRLQSKPVVEPNYRARMDLPLYMHGMDEAAFRSEITGVSETVPPSKVVGSAADTNITNNSPLYLSWEAATDNTSINRYEITRDGSLAGYNNDPNFYDTEVFAGKTYIYHVTAIDAGANRGQTSDSIMVVTPTTMERIINGEFEQGRSPWQTGIYAGGCVVDHSIDKTSKISGVKSAKLYVSQASGTDWHIQFHQNFDTKQGFTYEVTYTAVADRTTPLNMIVQENHLPYVAFISQAVTLTTTPQTFTISGIAPDNDSVGVQFLLGHSAPRTIWIDNVSVTETSPNPDPQDCSEVFSLGIDLTSDITDDCYVNSEDLQVVIDYWLNSDCGIHNDCQGADFEPDGNVDLVDLAELASEWPRCNNPQDTSCEPTW